MVRHIQFSIEETYSKVGFDRQDDFEVNAYYLTREESEEIRTLLLDIIKRREE